MYSTVPNVVDYTKNVNKQMSKQKCSFSCLKSTHKGEKNKDSGYFPLIPHTRRFFLHLLFVFIKLLHKLTQNIWSNNISKRAFCNPIIVDLFIFIFIFFVLQILD